MSQNSAHLNRSLLKTRDRGGKLGLKYSPFYHTLLFQLSGTKYTFCMALTLNIKNLKTYLLCLDWSLTYWRWGYFINLPTLFFFFFKLATKIFFPSYFTIQAKKILPKTNIDVHEQKSCKTQQRNNCHRIMTNMLKANQIQWFQKLI